MVKQELSKNSSVALKVQPNDTIFIDGKDDNFINMPLRMDGLDLLVKIHSQVIKVCFFDPQYRGILDKMNYGNEGEKKEQRRCDLSQMSDSTITIFIREIDRVLMPSGHLFLWIDKFHLVQGVQHWFSDTNLRTVDLIVWEKHKIGMGYRTRNKCEFILVVQKRPVKAKGIWVNHSIPNVMKEPVVTKTHPHSKPVLLQQTLIEAVSKEGDVVLDPAMGGGSVFEACKKAKRKFIGCDVNN